MKNFGMVFLFCFYGQNKKSQEFRLKRNEFLNYDPVQAQFNYFPFALQGTQNSRTNAHCACPWPQPGSFITFSVFLLP